MGSSATQVISYLLSISSCSICFDFFVILTSAIKIQLPPKTACRDCRRHKLIISVSSPLLMPLPLCVAEESIIRAFDALETNIEGPPPAPIITIQWSVAPTWTDGRSMDGWMMVEWKATVDMQSSCRTLWSSSSRANLKFHRVYYRP